MDKITDGLKHDGGKPRLSLVPAEAIEAIGAVMTHGAEKYGRDSYKQVEPERYRDALMRHVCKWLKDPHGVDEDSGLPHIWHIITNAAILCELDVDNSQKMVTHYSVAHSNINLTKEELETFKEKIARLPLVGDHPCEWKKLTEEEMETYKNLLAKQSLDVGHLIRVPDKEE